MSFKVQGRATIIQRIPMVPAHSVNVKNEDAAKQRAEKHYTRHVGNRTGYWREH